MVNKISIFLFLITFTLLPSGHLVAKQKSTAEGETLETLFVDPNRPDNSDDGQEPSVEGLGKIANISGYTLELVPHDSKEKTAKDFREGYIAVSDTRFLDVKGDEIDKEDFQVGEIVSIVYKQYSRYLVELRKAEILDPMKGGKKSSPPATGSKTIDNKVIKFEKGVYSN